MSDGLNIWGVLFWPAYPRERSDNEIAQEIQEQLVRQAELQRQQEECDAVRALWEA